LKTRTQKLYQAAKAVAQRQQDPANLRADAYRHVAEQYFKWLFVSLVVTGLVAWQFGWWALIPGLIALQLLVGCVKCLRREDDLRRDDWY
jgi:hypothetical protein